MPGATLSLRGLCLLALALGLLACSTTDLHERALRASRERAEAVARSGYQPSDQAQINSTLQHWRVQGQKTAVAFILPNYGSALAVVLYQPGLRESAGAGGVGRPAWAKAGCAVM